MYARKSFLDQDTSNNLIYRNDRRPATLDKPLNPNVLYPQLALPSPRHHKVSGCSKAARYGLGESPSERRGRSWLAAGKISSLCTCYMNTCARECTLYRGGALELQPYDLQSEFPLVTPRLRMKEGRLRKVLSFIQVAQLVSEGTPGFQQVLYLRRRRFPRWPSSCRPICSWGCHLLSSSSNVPLSKFIIKEGRKKEKRYPFTLNDEVCGGRGSTFQ